MEILEIIEKLRSESSTTGKIMILQSQSDNQEWKDYLLEVYDPFITYGQSGNQSDTGDLENLKLLRSIKAGVGVTLINKVYGANFIPVFQPMKASEIGKRNLRLEDLDFPLFAQIKYDGRLTHTIKKKEEVYHLTSGGFRWEHVTDPFEDCPDGVYISELLSPHVEGKLGERIYSGIETTFRTNTKKGKKNTLPFKLVTFDYITLEDFRRGYSETSYLERYQILKDLAESERLLLAESRFLSGLEEVLDYHSEIQEEGFEGLVLKYEKMKWRASKSRRKDFTKFKLRKTGDFLVKEEIPGFFKYQGQIGSLLLEDGEGKIVGAVGSGLSDSDRKSWGKFIGQVVEISYEQIINQRLIQPTFIALREKKELDII